MNTRTRVVMTDSIHLPSIVECLRAVRTIYANPSRVSRCFFFLGVGINLLRMISECSDMHFDEIFTRTRGDRKWMPLVQWQSWKIYEIVLSYFVHRHQLGQWVFLEANLVIIGNVFKTMVTSVTMLCFYYLCDGRAFVSKKQRSARPSHPNISEQFVSCINANCC